MIRDSAPDLGASVHNRSERTTLAVLWTTDPSDDQRRLAASMHTVMIFDGRRKGDAEVASIAYVAVFVDMSDTIRLRRKQS
eukprot:5732656-Prymnesium_polylepis.1